MFGEVVRWGPWFGFIQSPQIPVEAYFNPGCIATVGYQPRKGDQVEFEPVRLREDRYEARSVKPVSVTSRQPQIEQVPPASAATTATAMKQAPGNVRDPQSGSKPRGPAVSPVEPAKRPSGNDAGGPERLGIEFEKLRKLFARDLKLLQEKEQEQQGSDEAAKRCVADLEKQLEQARREALKAQRSLDAIRERLKSLPVEQAQRQEAAATEVMKSASVVLEKLLAERQGLADQKTGTRAEAVARLGVEIVTKYETARSRAEHGEDATAREAHQDLEKKARATVPAYATSLDNLYRSLAIPVPVYVFALAGGTYVTVLPLTEEGEAAADNWRLSSAFWDAVTRAAEAAGDPKPAAVRAAGCAARIRADDVDALIEEALREALSARPSLAEFKLAPSVEKLDAIPPAVAEGKPPEVTDRRPKSFAGGTVKEIADRLGLPVPFAVMTLVAHGLPFCDDCIDEATVRTLLQLLDFPLLASEEGAEMTTRDSGDDGVSSVKEAFESILREFPDRIAVNENSQSDIKNCRFLDTRAVRRALRFLATDYADARTGKIRCDDLNAKCREVSGFFYRAKQSEATMGKYPNFYETAYEGRKVTLEEHVGKGISKDPRLAIRIAFFFDREKGKVVVGFVGQHQETDST